MDQRDKGAASLSLQESLIKKKKITQNASISQMSPPGISYSVL